MKYLKYILFSILLSFTYINYVNAEEVCNFSYDTLKFTCKIDNNKVNCSYTGANKSSIVIEENNLSKEDIIDCEKLIIVSNSTLNKNHVYLYNKFANIPNKNYIELSGKKENITNTTNKLAEYNGKSCSYDFGVLNYTCTIENGSPNCSLKYFEEPLNYGLRFDNNSINILTANDFLSGNNFVCPTGNNNALHICGTKQGNINNVSYVGKSCGGLSDFGALTYSSNSSNNNGGGNNTNPNNPNGGNNTNPSNPSGGNNTNPNNPSGGNNTNPNNPSGGNNTNPNNPTTVYDPTSFCTKNEVKGAFRVLGWAIYIIKIVIPILLIVLGSIDVAKAVIASKDDELKKSLKTLGMRVAAGIIVFFIPTLIDFVVKIFNGDSIYDSNSGFGYCTHCILKPTDDACGSLMGGN